MYIPKTHPRYTSLLYREKISQAMKSGIVHETGLIAHGRGEAFDYLLGEETIPSANLAEKIGAAALLCAKNPVISLNGNVFTLAGKECILLAKAIPAKIEVNLFHRSEERINMICDRLLEMGAEKVYGRKGNAIIPGLNHDRAVCDRDGIFSADVVLVSIEDGDRCEALARMGKRVIAIDLNPLSRTARSASITIVDNVVRAISNIKDWVLKLRGKDRGELEILVKKFNNRKNLSETLSFISKRLHSLFRDHV
jgi:4-phosphopantoate--beta-alanine ligase